MTVRAALVCVCLLLATVAGGAERDKLIVRDVAVQNSGAGRIDESFVRAYISVRDGTELDRTDISRDVKALYATGRFSDVKVDAEELEDGVRLVYAVSARPKLAEPVEVRIVGDGHLSERKIRKLLELQVGDLVDDQVVGVRSAAVTQEYRKGYYPEVRVEHLVNLVEGDEGLARVIFTVKEGPRAKVREIRFEGNHSIPDSDLKAALEQPAWWNPLWWVRKRRFEAAELAEARLGVREIYMDRGFLDVEVDPPVTTVVDDGLVVSVRVREGRPYTVGQVSVSGVDLFPEVELVRLVVLLPGQPASSTRIRRSAMAVRDYYGSRGYIDTDVSPLLDTSPDTGVADIKFVVREGELVHIRNINVRGNTRTRDKVVRRELLVYPGDVYNEVRVRGSERRLQNLGYFSGVRSYPGSTRLEHEKDLIVEVEEKRTGQFMLGAGFSSVDNVVGFVELQQSNFDLTGWPYFTGGGQKLKLRAQFGTERQDFELSFVEPWFLNKRLLLGFDIYRSDVDYDDYNVRRTGAALRLGKSLPGPNRINLRYNLEESVVHDFADTNAYVNLETGEDYYFTLEEDAVKSTLRVSLTHDTRDNPFIPTRGTHATLSGALSGGPLGFDKDLYSGGLYARQYVPLWFGHVVSVRGRLDVIEEYGDTAEVPITDRLFIGGGRTLRGFEYRDVGPKAVRYETGFDGEQIVVDHRPLGGRTFALASAEYVVPIVQGLRLAAFYDIGGVWSDALDIDTDRLASSAGVGIRFDMPGFPIRVDRGWVIEKDDPLTDEDPWVIWMGHDF